MWGQRWRLSSANTLWIIRYPWYILSKTPPSESTGSFPSSGRHDATRILQEVLVQCPHTIATSKHFEDRFSSPLSSKELLEPELKKMGREEEVEEVDVIVGQITWWPCSRWNSESLLPALLKCKIKQRISSSWVLSLSQYYQLMQLSGFGWALGKMPWEPFADWFIRGWPPLFWVNI